MITALSDEYFMNEALKEAAQAASEGEVPIGAVVVCNQTIVARAHNLTEKLTDVTAHAEMLAITSAAQHLGGKYLENCVIYVSLEPCVMCAGALHHSHISKVVWAANDPKRGFTRYGMELLHPKTEIQKGLLANKSELMLKEFFQKRR
jgi:tRNA(adenine34) deaminase